jgi:hypothetical protein
MQHMIWKSVVFMDLLTERQAFDPAFVIFNIEVDIGCSVKRIRGDVEEEGLYMLSYCLAYMEV